MLQVPQHCPVCRRMIAEGHIRGVGDVIEVACPTCGEYKVSDTVASMLTRRIHDDPVATAKVSWSLRRMQEQSRWPMLHSGVLTRILKEVELPSPREQADNLVLWLGRRLRESGSQAKETLDPDACAAIMGAVGFDGSHYILTHLGDSRIVDARPKSGREGGPWEIGLRFEGWDRFFELEHRTVESHIAFMAMQFGKADLDRVYRECFRPAITATGFDLRRIDHDPPAGLIDNRLRVEIRRARFMVADLTYANPGAYWESGFSEGLGRPVIYTCERAYFHDKKTHFDTNHSLTIIWSADGLDAAAKQLKAAVRATLPAEAKPPAEDESI